MPPAYRDILRSCSRLLSIVAYITLIGSTGKDVAAQTKSEGTTVSLQNLGEQEDSDYSFLTDNLRWAIDLSARGIFDNRRDEWFSAFFAGLDLHKVFTGPSGDWGTLTLQPYLTRINNPSHPPFFESNHDWELVYRISNFNYTGLADGRLNIRVGHMEIPFGLEQVINTNGTLRDYIHGRNIGVKADWGVSVNGELADYEYELALTRGTGNEWSSRGDPFLIAGRVGTNRDESFSVGVSALQGEVQKTALLGNTQERTRFGADFVWQTEPVIAMGEISIGKDDGVEVVNGLLELDWTNPCESILVYDQILYFNADLPNGWDHAIANVLGVRWSIDSQSTISAQWNQDLSTFSGSQTTEALSLQVRHRF